MFTFGRFFRSGLIFGVVWMGVVCATEAADSPSVGWRGDGTGRFAESDPPVNWNRRSSSLLWGMRNASDIEANDAGVAGEEISPALGWLTHWRVREAVAVKDGAKALDGETVASEGQLHSGTKDAGGNWKDLAAGPEISLTDVLGAGENRVTYLHTWVYVKAGGKVGLWVSAHTYGVRVWVNEKPVFTRDKPGDGNARARTVVDLHAGWNSLLYKVTQADRGWFLTTWLSAAHPVSYETTNIAWARRLPGVSMASPIVVGEKLFCVSEPDDLVCMEKTSGKILWIRRTTLYDVASDDEKKLVSEKATLALARLSVIDQQQIDGANSDNSKPLDSKVHAQKEHAEKEIADLMNGVDRKKYKAPFKQDHGYATPTPCSDGQRVYVSYTTGIGAAYDLEGNRLWTTFVNHGNPEHGNHYSPVLAGGKVIYCMNNFVRAVDKLTGKQIWEVKDRVSSCNSPVVTQIEGEDVVVTASGTLLRASNGEAVGTPGLFQSSGCVTPVVQDGVIYAMSGGGNLLAVEVPKSLSAKQSKVLWKVPLGDKALEAEFGVKTIFAGGFVASPLYHDGLLYLVSEGGILIVVDAKSGERVYGKTLDLHPRIQYISAPGVAASPALAGGKIYIFDNSGESVVLKPGREFKMLAKNTLENILGPMEWNEAQEQLMSTPFFDGKSIYIRSPEWMYCIRK